MLSDEGKLHEYWDWLQRLKQPHNVGFTVSQEGWVEAMEWALHRISELKLEVREKQLYVEMLERECGVRK